MCPDAPAKQHRGIHKRGDKSAHEERQQGAHPSPRRGQRPNGQYYFKFKDVKGKTKYKYSWTLTTHDLPPKGKSRGRASEIEKQVQRDV